MFKQKQQFTKKSDFWNTPLSLYNLIRNDLEYIDYNEPNSFIHPFDDDADLYYNSKIYINPPFSLLGDPVMLSTITKLLENGNEILFLMPSRTDTKYFHSFLNINNGFGNPMIYFFQSRLKFNDLGSAPFPSLLLHYSNKITDLEFLKEKIGGFFYGR